MSRLANTPTGRALTAGAKQRKAAGQRGKDAESDIRTFLKKLSAAHAHFDFQREPDARTAGGRIGKRTGDFTFYLPGMHGVVEVKELKHEYRLPRDRFIKDKNDSLARLHRRRLAGGYIIVLVYHTEIGLWRRPTLGWLQEGAANPSWDMRELSTYPTLADALSPLVTLCHGGRHVE